MKVKNIIIVSGVIILTLLILLNLITDNSVEAKRLNPEKYYQEVFCDCQPGKTEIEFILPDKTRVDCLTESHAIEHDFANKWAEAIGQALKYAASTGKKAGICLIMENPEKDQRYLNYILETVNYHNLDIDIWIMKIETDCVLTKRIDLTGGD